MNRLIQIITSVLVILGMMMLSSCRCGVSTQSHATKVITKVVTVKPFDRICVNGPMTVRYVQGNTESVKIVDEEDNIDGISVSSDGSTLKITCKKDGFFGGRYDNDTHVYITSSDLIGVDLSGSGEFIADKHVDTDNMNLSVSGSGTVSFADIVCDRIKGELVGSGDININNVICGEAIFNCIGSGDITANVRSAKTVNMLLQGSGDIDLNARDCNSVTSDLQGSGDITISGNIKNLQKNIMGSGDYDTGNLRIEKQK